PTVQLVPDAGHMQEDGDHLGLPRPGRARGDDDQLRMAGGDLVEMARMACVQANATAAGLTRTDAGRADHDEDRNAGVRAQAVERLVAWIVGGHVEPRA